MIANIKPIKVERMRTPETIEENIKEICEQVEDLFFFSPEENHLALADQVEKKIQDIIEAARKGEYF